MSEVTEILLAVEAGDTSAADRLLPLVYEELRKLAAKHRANERPGQTLQPTALVHEAYLRLVGIADAARFSDRSHFLAAAAIAIRRILIDNARRKQTVKHGGEFVRQSLDHAQPILPEPAEDLLALDEAASTKLADGPSASGPARADPLFRRAHAPRRRPGPGRVAAHGRPTVGLRSCLAAPRNRRFLKKSWPGPDPLLAIERERCDDGLRSLPP